MMKTQRAAIRITFMPSILQVKTKKCYNHRMTPAPDSARESNLSAACLRCGECCTRYQVLLEEFEIEQVAGYLGITVEKLKEKYTDPRWPVPGKFLLRHRDKGGCIFLVYQGKQALCSVHIAKPKSLPRLDTRLLPQGMQPGAGAHLGAGGQRKRRALWGTTRHRGLHGIHALNIMLRTKISTAR